MAYNPRSTASVMPYAVGNKVYGGGRPFPTNGPVDPTGYRERDARSKARRNALLRRMKSDQSGKFGSADSLRTV
jgi:hypothetical protein